MQIDLSVGGLAPIGCGFEHDHSPLFCDGIWITEAGEQALTARCGGHARKSPDGGHAARASRVRWAKRVNKFSKLNAAVIIVSTRGLVVAARSFIT
jgi:hypothetical protein